MAPAASHRAFSPVKRRSLPTEPEERGGLPLTTWGLAALIVVVVVGALVLFGWKKPVPAPNTLLPADGYAASLPLTQFAMSESANLTGGKQTYLDGHIGNTGDRMVVAVTVQVVFQNDVELSPQIDTVPLTLIRHRRPVHRHSAGGHGPAKAGRRPRVPPDLRDGPENWNQQMPEVRVIHTEFR